MTGPMTSTAALAARIGADLGRVRPQPGTQATAAVVLGFVSEPGDGVLGRVAEILGAEAAAAALLAGTSAGELADRVGASGEGAPSARELAAGLGRWMPRLDLDAIARSVAQAARVGARLVLPGDQAWPVGLDDLGAHAPHGLWVRGRPAALAARASIALVGARAATGYGEHVAVDAAAGLADRGFTVVSGGAYGIDGAAHRSTLASGGTTVAYLAGGIDRFYPAGHEGLLGRIAETGAVVSELPCGAAPTRWRFLQRNRMIAAVATATVVIEAGLRSGSLNTAGHAATLGRALGAVPGPVTSPASAGCHRLLREYAAVCVTDAAQMAELVGVPDGGDAGDGDVRTSASADPTDRALAILTSDERRVLDALAMRRVRSIEELVRSTGMASGAVRGALGALDATGLATRAAGGWVRRRTG
ncbi:DNA-processing protein DprA [Agromyces marinus]|uniref:DNA processing protein DprA n=1 Tax=Agromyces marinus TaxID=1389020 RepID=A0ABM8H5U5_9MICO|nr:DNA-processing protein DprA [Agromyces marinus]UIP58871.1 Putative DNA processing protein DprA [Agromyces marinus]BDZ56177.1 DNA processing protein DprA [Agromyces marinus]